MSMNRLFPWRRWPRPAGVLAGLVVAALGLGAPPAGAGETPVPRIDRRTGPAETLSSSGQFLARGPLQSDRAVLVTRAEEVREEVDRLLLRAERRGEPADAMGPASRQSGRPPVVINLWLQGDARPPLHARLFRMEGVPQPVLGLVVARAALAGTDGFRREIVRLLLVERMIRAQPESAAAGRGDVLPAWLETGVLEALDHLRAGRPSARYAALFTQGRILAIDDILTVQPSTLEAGARDVFATSACCLVLALLDQPEGPDRFRHFLEAAPARQGSWQNLLVRSFPGLALSRHSLEKWWALQAATLATPDLLEPMTAAETEAVLARALLVRCRPGSTTTAAPSPVVRWLRNWIPGRPAPVAVPSGATEAGEEVVPLAELDRIAGLPRRAEVLRANQGALSALLLRAFPLYRPIIEEYQQVLGQLSLGKAKGLSAQCDALIARRREVLATAEAATDLLNWYEATQRGQLSGTFDRYFELLDTPGPSVPRPTEDPIARTLDELEEEFAVP